MDKTIKDSVISYASKEYRVSRKSVLETRVRESSNARMLIIYILRKHFNYTWHSASIVIGKKTHGAAIYLYKKAINEYSENKDFRNKYNKYALLYNN